MTISNAIDWYRLEPREENLGIAQTAGTTFTVQSANGSALSITNCAYVTLQSLANPGRLKLFRISANQTFTQAGLGNNLFGVTTAVNIAQDVPFFLYAVSNSNNGENTIAFMISRFPNSTISPIAAKIGQSGNTNATTQGSFFSLSTITAADYASSPCLCIGSFRMRYATSLWTVQTLNISDGIGQFQKDVMFQTVAAQFGAAASSFFYANGGTAPQFTNSSTGYKISMDNMLYFEISFTNCTTGGVGAVTAQLAAPLQVQGATNGTAVLNVTGTTTTMINIKDGGSTTNNQIEFYVTGGATNNFLQNVQIAAGANTALNVNVYAPIGFI